MVRLPLFEMLKISINSANACGMVTARGREIHHLSTKLYDKGGEYRKTVVSKEFKQCEKIVIDRQIYADGRAGPIGEWEPKSISSGDFRAGIGTLLWETIWRSTDSNHQSGGVVATDFFKGAIDDGIA